LLVCLAAAAIYSFWIAYKSWRENRLVEDTAASRVRSAAQGYVEISGRGFPPTAEYRAPLTRKPCTWWRYEIEKRGGIGTSRGWTTVDSAVSETPFLIDDGTGQCLIDPRGAEVFPKARSVWYGDTEWPQVHLPDGAGLLGKLVEVLMPKGPYRYTEVRLEPHEPLCVLGAHHSVGGVDVDGADLAVGELLRRWKQDQKALLARFDTNHDGRLQSEEWDGAREAARQQVLDQMIAQPPTAARSVVAKPTDGRAFLLSASDGRSLARRLRRTALAGMAMGAAACAAATVLWLAAFVW